LKRQYKIRNSKMKYFFDCSVRITDEILQEVLNHDTSAKDSSLYDDITEILNKDKTIKLSLNKGYRSTCEINRFTRNLLGEGTQHDSCSIERYGEEPMVIH